MSIEKALADLTVALNENTAALKAAGGGKPAASGTPTPPSTPKKEDKKVTTLQRGEVNAALTDVKEKKGAPAAKAIITEHGGVAKMADIPEEKFQAVYDAAKAALKEEEGGDI
jgi:putative intracellular protease/amidase